MQAAEPRQRRQFMGDARVIFHGAGTEGVKLRVDGKIFLTEAGIMAYHLEFRGIGQGQVRTQQMPRDCQLRQQLFSLVLARKNGLFHQISPNRRARAVA